MTVAEFWVQFTQPLDPETLLLAFVLGVVTGLVAFQFRHTLSRAHCFWQAAGGAIFFVPLAVFRAYQGSDVWPRFLATYILWLVFIFGMSIRSRFK
jgi:multisubunit Na+/H+ antiporter MnhE subunit